MARSKYKKLTDLYVEGIELPLAEDVVMWLQVMNPFEVQEARKAATTAAARFVLAMKEVGSPEFDQIKASMVAKGEVAVIDDLLESKGAEHFLKATQDVEVDPEWRDRVEILQRVDEIEKLGPDDPEQKLLTKINEEWYAEIIKRVRDEQDYYRQSLERMGFDELLNEFSEAWMNAHGNDKASHAYGLTEIYYAARVCEAKPNEDGEFTKASHIDCNGHKERVFDSVDEVRELPAALHDAIRLKLNELEMGVREAGNSPRLLSSSESSQQPSPVEASTPSTPDETSQPVPGT